MFLVKLIEIIYILAIQFLITILITYNVDIYVGTCNNFLKSLGRTRNVAAPVVVH